MNDEWVTTCKKAVLLFVWR